MTRVYVVAEGATESNFVQQILKPHLERMLPAIRLSASNIKNRLRMQVYKRKCADY